MLRNSRLITLSKKFDRVGAQIKRAKSFSLSVDRFSPIIDDKISTMQKSTPSLDMFPDNHIWQWCRLLHSRYLVIYIGEEQSEERLRD